MDVKEESFPNVVGVFCCDRYRERSAWTLWSVPFFCDAALGLIHCLGASLGLIPFCC